MLTKNELLEVATRWGDDHEPEDFEIIYKAFHPVIINTVSKYHPSLHYRELAPRAISALLKALKTYYAGTSKTSLYTWTASIISAEVHRFAGSLLYPGVPESQRPGFVVEK